MNSANMCEPKYRPSCCSHRLSQKHMYLSEVLRLAAAASAAVLHL